MISTLVRPSILDLPSRIERLESCLAGCRGKLRVQERVLVDIRRGAVMLSNRSQGMHETLENLSLHVDILTRTDPMPRRRPGWFLQIVPYLVILAVGLDYRFNTPPLPAPAALTADLPKPAIASALPTVEDSRKNEALRLLYEYQVPGTDWDMLDLIGTQEAILGPSPWALECVSENLCTVSFVRREGWDEEPLYRFEVNLAAKTVVPAPETVRKLLAASLSRTAVL